MRKGSSAWFLAPSFVLICLVTVYPIFYVFYLSMQRRQLLFGISEFVGAGNYLSVLGDGRFWNALGNTAYFTAASVSLELLLGLGVAVLLNRTFRLKGITRAIVLVPWAIPTVVSARMWELIYNSDFGILNYLLGVRVNWLGSPFWALNAAVFMDVWKTTPFVAVLLMAGLQNVPPDLYRAARVDGAGPWAAFRNITLPLLKPIIVVVLIFRTLDAFRIFDAIYVLTGGGPANSTETLSIYAYKVLFQTLQFGYGSALSVIVFMSTGFISLFYIKLLRREVR
jgi:multiple sugar transport system permease protein